MPAYAHSLENQPPDKWETMAEHEALVAKYCRQFLTRIGAELGEWGELLGKWHDVGKYSTEFQQYISAANVSDVHCSEVKGRGDHSTAAAQHFVSLDNLKGRFVAYAFAGHHAGLPDWDNGESQAGLKQRLEKTIPAWKPFTNPSLLEGRFPAMPKLPTPDDYGHASFRVSFFIRMMFSALVDADFLATEAFMSPEKQKSRPTEQAKFASLREQLEFHLRRFEGGEPSGSVNAIRKTISACCLEKSELPTGFFSLNVPTGGGKTLGALRFALAHAIENKLSRVVFGVPFTSIIEQNANVYRQIFQSIGDDVVLEHHSNLDPAKETTVNRLQAENWDAPLIVTTNVQLFESLFASRTSKCRKLHRLAKSVIVLDEAQTLPVELLQPTLMVLRELVEVFGCSVVLCSATQPALVWREDFRIGLRNVQPIIDDVDGLHQSMRRTKVELAGTLDDEQLAGELKSNSQVLCIVNTRPTAANVFALLSEDDGHDCFHLSTRMCAVHREKTLTTIRNRLDAGEPCKVVSTQLIEAGVDVDFPVVYRASCGLDSLAQAAGRCNREGRLELGRVVWFEGEKEPPPGFLRQSADSAKEIQNDFDDLLSPAAIQAYFELHYWKKCDDWDHYEVLQAIGNQPNNLQFNFRQVSERYKFIRDETESIIVGWDDQARELLQRLETSHPFPDRKTIRCLQRYCVQVRQHEFLKLQKADAIGQIQDRWVLTMGHLYDDRLGLMLDKVDGVLPVEDCIC